MGGKRRNNWASRAGNSADVQFHARETPVLHLRCLCLPAFDPFSHSSSPSLCMAAASIYTTRVSGDEYLHRPSSPTTSLSPTLVNNPHHIERPSHKLRIPSGASDILNSVVVNAAGQSLYSITSNSKRTTLVSCADNVEVATVQWDRASPRMVFRRKKIKCKTWLPLTGPQNEYIPAPFDP